MNCLLKSALLSNYLVSNTVCFISGSDLSGRVRSVLNGSIFGPRLADQTAESLAVQSASSWVKRFFCFVYSIKRQLHAEWKVSRILRAALSGIRAAGHSLPGRPVWEESRGSSAALGN